MTRGDANESISRRGFVTAMAGGVAAAGTATTAAASDDGTTTTTTGTGNETTTSGGTTTTTTTTTTSGTGEVDFGSWFEKAETFDGLVDKRGQDAVTVEVGPKDTEGAPYNFAPPAIRVDPGTEITWTWKSNTHNIVVADQPDGAGWKGTEGGSGKYYDEGHTYSNTFETTGIFAYYCAPHKSLGMKGAVVVGDVGGSVDTGGEKTTEKKDQQGGGNKSPDETVTVGPGGELVFDPANLTITPGTTVKWVWESNNHNIVVGSQPDGTNWKGTAGPASKTYNSGHTYTHTFETKGTYEYWCQPHKAAGMVGSVEVKESAGGGGTRLTLPNSALTLGVATIAAMLSTLSLAYFFLRYGGDYETPAE